MLVIHASFQVIVNDSKYDKTVWCWVTDVIMALHDATILGPKSKTASDAYTHA